MRARFYNPEIRRFVVRDVLLGGVADGQTLNRFAFVGGRPVSFVDPFGLDASLYPKDPMTADPSDYVLPNSTIPYDINKIIRGEQAPPDWNAYWKNLLVNVVACALLGGKIFMSLPKGCSKVGKKLGDLTIEEINQIQHIVDKVGKDIHIVGSAAKGTQRNIGTDYPIGKKIEGGPQTKSDIDYVMQGNYKDKLKLDEAGLPALDSHGVLVRKNKSRALKPGKPHIQFSPGKEPQFIPGNK